MEHTNRMTVDVNQAADIDIPMMMGSGDECELLEDMIWDITNKIRSLNKRIERKGNIVVTVSPAGSDAIARPEPSATTILTVSKGKQYYFKLEGINTRLLPSALHPGLNSLALNFKHDPDILKLMFCDAYQSRADDSTHRRTEQDGIIRPDLISYIRFEALRDGDTPVRVWYTLS